MHILTYYIFGEDLKLISILVTRTHYFFAEFFFLYLICKVVSPFPSTFGTLYKFENNKRHHSPYNLIL